MGQLQTLGSIGRPGGAVPRFVGHVGGVSGPGALECEPPAR